MHLFGHMLDHDYYFELLREEECHAGARSYEEASSHPDMLALAASNQLSCMSSNCHDIVHDVGTLKDATFWTPKAKGK
jgi:hypothetical protein